MHMLTTPWKQLTVESTTEKIYNLCYKVAILVSYSFSLRFLLLMLVPLDCLGTCLFLMYVGGCCMRSYL